MQQTENISPSDENILAYSIKQAREKFLRQPETHYNAELQGERKISTSLISNGKNTAAAGAIKILRTRVYELEQLNQTLKIKNAELQKDLSQKEKQLVQTQASIKSQDKEIISRYQEELRQVKKKYSEFSQYEQWNERLKQIEMRENLLKEKQQSLKESDHSSIQVKKIQERFQQKIVELNKRNDIKQNVITQLIKDLEEEREKKKQSKLKSGSKIEKHQEAFPIIVEEPSLKKVAILSSDDEKEWSTAKLSNNKKSYKVKEENQDNQYSIVSLHNSKAINKLKGLKQKNQELFKMAKTAEKKNKSTQHELRQVKEKFYKLRSLMGDMIEQIHKLPHNISNQFKILIVKCNKLDVSHMQCLRTNSSHRFLRSVDKGSGSKQRSGSKKPLKMEDLNGSARSSIYSHSKNISGYQRKSQTFISSDSKGRQGIKRKNGKDQIVKELKKQIRVKRREIRELHRIIEEEDSSNTKKQLQLRLNDLLEEESVLTQKVNNYSKNGKKNTQGLAMECL